MIFDNIYNLFKIKTDGEEFDSPDDALTMANVAYRKILAIRDWLFLKKTTTISITSSSYDYTDITDIDKPLALWYGDCQLKKAIFEKRKNYFDYWIDYASKEINFINDFSGKALELDYKYRPADINGETEIEDILGQCIAYQMILDYFEKDQDTSVYQEAYANYQKCMNILTDYNESLRH